METHPSPKLFPSSRAATLALVFTLAGGAWAVQAADTVWNFTDPFDPFFPESGPGFMEYWDPDQTGWGPVDTQFGKASSFGLPPMPDGGDPDVMRFPACTSRQGYIMYPQTEPNGTYADLGKVSNYTFIMDVLYPSESDAQWRPFWQANVNNDEDAEAYVQAAPSGGIGILGRYHGSIKPNTWHRVAFVVRAAEGEGQMHKYIDGVFVGAQGTTGSGLDLRWALDEALLLFTDDNGETAPGYVASIYFVGHNMSMDEVEALGGPNSAGANVPGSPGPPLGLEMDRLVRPIGHRGNSCCAPEDTLVSIRQAFSNHAAAVEIDIRLSADGIPVVMHDPTVDRTTDGSGDVAALTVADLKTLDAGSWFGPQYAGEPVPTLVEAFQTVKEYGGIAYLDLKVGGMGLALANALLDADYPPDKVWFWVGNDEASAQDILTWIPEAKIVFGAPPDGWQDDPTFFAHRRELGCYMFDLGAGNGQIDPVFAARAKAEGFKVAVFTILDPDAMLTAAANGVDFMETDFPAVLHDLNPTPLPEASRPHPPDGATDLRTTVVLSWLVGQDVVTNRVYLGTNNPPPLVSEQTHDLFLADSLARGATYYWRVDTVTPSGVVPGPVWSFQTIPPGILGPKFEWTFDAGDLSATLGNGLMTYADGAVTEGLTEFGVTDDTTVPHINGEPAYYMHVPAFTDDANGYYVTFPDSQPNGGGQYINQFTVIFDVYIPEPMNWVALFNTQPSNANDADFYVRPDGALGIGALGYSPAGTIEPNTWYRIAFVADLPDGTVTYYVNGEQVHQRTGGALTDGRFSLYSSVDNRPSFLLFNEGDQSGVYTHELYLSSFAFTDRTLDENDMAELGGPNALGVFVKGLPPLAISWSEGMVNLTWPGAPNIRLQKTLGLAPADWQDVADTAGKSSYSEPATEPAAFYRLVR